MSAREFFEDGKCESSSLEANCTDSDPRPVSWGCSANDLVIPGTLGCKPACPPARPSSFTRTGCSRISCALLPFHSLPTACKAATWLADRAFA